MIRINLIRQEGRSEKKGLSIDFAASDMTKQLAFVALFIVTIALCVWFWFDIDGKRNTVTSQVAEATRELERLKIVKEKIERLNAEQEKLTLRHEILDNLKNNLRTPLEEIALAYAMQLSHSGVSIASINHAIDIENGDSITLNGDATQEELNAYSDALLEIDYVRMVDIISQVGETFQIKVMFHAIRGFGSTEVAEPETAQTEGGTTL